MRGPQEKKERSLGVRLGLKNERATSPKSALTRKPYKPGVHGPHGRPKALSEFGLQLREKSKFKVTYGVNESNLKRLFAIAVLEKGAIGTKVLQLLEMRLDSVVYHLGLAQNRASARQLVIHGHIMVNKKKVKSPGYQVRKGDVISVNPTSKKRSAFSSEKQKEFFSKYEAPAWLKLDTAGMFGEVVSLPTDLTPPYEINLLVDSFSK